MSDLPLVVFVCVHNAGRSRMAEAFFNELAGGRYRAVSAGTEPAGSPHPVVVESMAEAGIEVPATPGTLLTEELVSDAVKVIGMGCNVHEACPALRVPLDDWWLPDPKGRSLDEVREIREEIRERVEKLISELNSS